MFYCPSQCSSTGWKHNPGVSYNSLLCKTGWALGPDRHWGWGQKRFLQCVQLKTAFLAWSLAELSVRSQTEIPRLSGEKILKASQVSGNKCYYTFYSNSKIISLFSMTTALVQFFIFYILNVKKTKTKNNATSSTQISKLKGCLAEIRPPN